MRARAARVETVRSNNQGHDIVVVGASAGGVEALMNLVSGLPADFRAAVFVVLHTSPGARSALADILNRSGPLSATEAENKEPISHGHIYVAPPNRHLVLHHGHVALEPGPRENNARPSVDVLFRSAARSYGRRVVGVVLSGALRDGALGLAAIKMRGGVTMVQDPAEALFAGMPESALGTTQVDFCLRAADIPLRLDELTQHSFEHPSMQPSESSQPDITVHAADEPVSQFSPKLPNAASGLTCPECHGSLWEVDGGGAPRFECRIGHAYGVDALLANQGEAVEAAIWSAVNALQERAATFHRLADNQPHGRTAQPAYRERAELIERHAATLLDLLHELIRDGQVG
jgi:two-component system chemotaxis response regulator CheB